ncbi:MAG: hypothetical protein A2096_04135 [Spirochaetes bacterium GWF1_41_5]|nr:MAG: hypothetical protein A2096_04135 [Spirochaetes bacterium GWF1_41_5]
MPAVSGLSSDKKVTIKNRLFVPGLANPALSSVQINFSNPNREQVRVQVFDANGKIVIKDDFDDWHKFLVMGRDYKQRKAFRRRILYCFYYYRRKTRQGLCQACVFI